MHPRSFLEGDVDCNESLVSERGSLSQLAVLQRQLVAGKLPPGILSRESLSCSCRLELSLGLVSQGRDWVWGEGEDSGAWPSKEALTILQAASHSMCLPLPRQQTSVTPWSLAGCSLSTPMGSEVISSIPSSVKPAFSSLTYFSHSAVLEQCLALFLV